MSFSIHVPTIQTPITKNYTVYMFINITTSERNISYNIPDIPHLNNPKSYTQMMTNTLNALTKNAYFQFKI